MHLMITGLKLEACICHDQLSQCQACRSTQTCLHVSSGQIWLKRFPGMPDSRWSRKTRH